MVYRPPPVFVNVLPRSDGSNVLPAPLQGNEPGRSGKAQTSGCSVKTTFGLITDDVAVTSTRCFPVRYSAAVTRILSGSGLIVTGTATEVDDISAELLAVMVSVTNEVVT
jgi:hypothetical protein